MKQTNNAIKFLMAQYRAIFKNANIAMVAAMVASALAAGQANAALNLGASADQATESATVSGKEDLSGSKGGYINDLTIASGGSLSFDGSKTVNTGHISVANSLTVQSGGSLNVTGGTVCWGIIGTHEYDNNGNPLFDNANSTFILESGGEVNVTKSQIQMSNVNLSGGTVTVGTNNGNVSESDFADNAQINAVLDASGNGGLFTIAGAKVTLNSGSILNAKTFNLNSGTINMKGTEQDSESAVIRAFGGGTVNLNGVAIATTGSGNYIGAEGGINMKSGSIFYNCRSVCLTLNW